LSRDADKSETFRRDINDKLQEVVADAEAPPPRPGGKSSPEPSPAQRPAQAPGDPEASRPPDAPAPAGSGAPGGYELGHFDVDAYEIQHGRDATNAMLQRMKRKGDRAAGE